MEYSCYDFLKLIGSLGLFLYGMKIMSEGLQKVAGDRDVYKRQMIDTTREARMIPVIYHGIFNLRIISRQNTYEIMVSRIGT